MGLTDRASQLDALDTIMGHIQQTNLSPLLRILMIHEVTIKVMRGVKMDISAIKKMKDKIIGTAEEAGEIDSFLKGLTIEI